MDIYKQIVEPTRVLQSLACCFTDFKKSNLVVSKGTKLEIYSINEQTHKLSLLADYKLHGLITEIRPLRTHENKELDYLVISTKFAKISIIKWNFELHNIETVSLHYYENFFENNSPIDSLDNAQLIVSPDNECACMIFNDLLAFLPFKKDSGSKKKSNKKSKNDDDDDDDNYSDDEDEEMVDKKLVKVDEDEDDDDEDDEDEEDENGSFTTLHKPTFIVPANKLDSSISDIITCKFLHNYREPTLAILFSPTHTWAGNVRKSKDVANLVVISLDLHKKTSTTIIFLKNLPYDLYDVIPLESPVGGFLLVGCNELIHVDSAGSSQGIMVNHYTENITDFRNFTKNQKDLNVMLENCQILQMPSVLSKKLLLITEVGEFYWIVFKLDGRLVKNFQLVKIDQENYQNIFLSHPSSIVGLNHELFFVGCYDGDSLLLNWKNLQEEDKKKTEKVEKPIKKEKTKNDDNDDDDIDYSDLEDEEKLENQEIENDDDGEEKSSLSNTKFSIVDKVFNCGPISNVTLATLSTDKLTSGLSNPNFSEISAVASSGYGKLGSITTIDPSIKPEIKSTMKFSDVDRVWTLATQSVKKTSKGVKLEKDYNYLITTNSVGDKSDCFSITDNFKNVSEATEFQDNESIITIGFINKKQNIIHITKMNIYLYGLNFKLIKKFKINELIDSEDESAKEIDLNGDKDGNLTENLFELIVTAFIYEDFILLTTSKGQPIILESNLGVLNSRKIKTNSKFFNKISIPSMLQDTLITTGTIGYSSLIISLNNWKSVIDNLNINKRKKSSSNTLSSLDFENSQKDYVFVLVTGDNEIVLFQKNHKEKVFTLDHIDKLTEILTLNFFSSIGNDPDPFIKQVSFTRLGDEIVSKEYLTVLTIGGETYLYELYYDKINDICKFKKIEKFLVTGAPDNAFPWGTRIERRLVYIDDFQNGLKCLFITGITPYFIIKQSHSHPRIYKFTKFPAISFASFKTKLGNNNKPNFFNFNDNGSNFIYLDDLKNARVCSIPFGETISYTNILPMKKISIGSSIKSITYHETSKMFVLSTFEEIDYDCVDEENVPIAGSEMDKPHAKNFKGSLKLLSPKNWIIIDEVEFEDNQLALTIKSMFLNTSTSVENNGINFFNNMMSNNNTNNTQRQKEVVLVGTGKLRMEDLVSNGSFHLYDIIDIIPEIGKPEFNHKFKEIFKESTRGAITAITEVSGRFLISQGQKVLVRDLQEDNTVVPVAFLDTSIYVSEAKSFGNLLILGDVMKSIWLVGFDAEPYRMIMISKDVINVDVNAADFITFNGELYFVIGDNNENLHLLQYNPEDPASLSGQRLVRKTTFNLNTTTTTMRSYPIKSGGEEFQVMGGNIDGSVYVITPISEDSYRKLYVLQQQLIDKELHYLGLNPKMNRISKNFENINSHFTSNSNQQTKIIIDYDVLQTFLKLNNDRKRQLALKVGRFAYTEIWKELVELNFKMF